MTNANDNKPSKLKVLAATVAVAVAGFAVKVASAVVYATVAVAVGFILSYSAAWLLPSALPLAPLAVAKLGGLLGLGVRIVKEAA